MWTYVFGIDIRSFKKVYISLRLKSISDTTYSPGSTKKEFNTRTTPPPPRRFSNTHSRPLTPVFLSAPSSASLGPPFSSSSPIFALDCWALGPTAVRYDVWEGEAMAIFRHSRFRLQLWPVCSRMSR